MNFHINVINNILHYVHVMHFMIFRFEVFIIINLKLSIIAHGNTNETIGGNVDTNFNGITNGTIMRTLNDIGLPLYLWQNHEGTPNN